MKNTDSGESIMANTFVQGGLKSLGSASAPFKLPSLPYATNALVKAVDEETLKIHHGKHHSAYVEKLNKALGDKTPTLNEVIQNASKWPTPVRNNAGGHWNHTFFWTILSGVESDNELPIRIKKEIESKWETIAKFQAAFEKAGSEQFGSGWAWLIRTPAGLDIVSSSNQDNPLMDLAEKKGWPILCVDVWEHSYYLRYQNMRADYLKNIWKIVNWKMVDQYDQEAIRSAVH